MNAEWSCWRKKAGIYQWVLYINFRILGNGVMKKTWFVLPGYCVGLAGLLLITYRTLLAMSSPEKSDSGFCEPVRGAVSGSGVSGVSLGGLSCWSFVPVVLGKRNGTAGEVSRLSRRRRVCWVARCCLLICLIRFISGLRCLRWEMWVKGFTRRRKRLLLWMIRRGVSLFRSSSNRRIPRDEKIFLGKI